MPGGLAIPQGSSDAWPEMGAQAERAFNTGWIPDQAITSTGGFSTNTSPSSSSSSFFSTGDATGFYLPGRRVKAVQGATTVYGEVVSSSCGPAGSTTSTQVTVGKFVNSTGLSTGPFTSVAVGYEYPSTGGGSSPQLYDFGTQVMVRNWGL